jgi:tRNA splicing endonuclease
VLAHLCLPILPLLPTPEDSRVEFDFETYLGATLADQPSTRWALAVFRDLWLAGYSMTNGVRCGASFMIYPGDPSQHHAEALVVIVGPGHTLTVPL